MGAESTALKITSLHNYTLHSYTGPISYTVTRRTISRLFREQLRTNQCIYLFYYLIFHKTFAATPVNPLKY